MIRRILSAVALVASTSFILPAPAGAGLSDCPVSNISVNDVTVGEGAGTADFSVTLDRAPSCEDLTVDFATEDGTAAAGSDYTATSGTLTFSLTGEETQKTVSVPVTDDDQDEPDETFTLNLSNPSTHGAIADGTGTGTITDNDEAPTTTAAPTTTTTAPPTSTISDDNPAPGDDVDLTASGFKGGSETEIFFLSEPILLTTATADSGGVVRATITIPEDAQAGAHTIEVRGVDSSDTPRTVSIPITVAGEVTDTTAAAQPLAATGSGLSTLILVAGVLAAAGGTLLLQVRRRRMAGAS